MTRKPCRMCASTGTIHIDPQQPCGRPDHWIACPTCETSRLRDEVRLYRRALRDVRVTASVAGSLSSVADTLTRIHDISRAALARRRMK